MGYANIPNVQKFVELYIYDLTLYWMYIIHLKKVKIEKIYTQHSAWSTRQAQPPLLFTRPHNLPHQPPLPPCLSPFLIAFSSAVWRQERICLHLLIRSRSDLKRGPLLASETVEIIAKFSKSTQRSNLNAECNR